MEQKNKKQVNPIVIGAVIFGIIAAVLLIITLTSIFRTNPYGNETKIDNIASAYGNLPQNEKDLIFFQLHNVILENLNDGENVPKSGALVREGTADYNYDKNTQVYAGNFVVDVPPVEQSYQVQFEWSPVDNNQNLGGYPVLITCLPENLKIYAGDKCKDSFSEYVVWKNEYQIDYTYGTTTSHKIKEMIESFLTDVVDAPSYEVVVDEVSLKRLKAQPDLTYQFVVKLNDLSSYTVIVRTDEMYGEKYVAMYINGAEGAKGFLAISSGDLEESLTTWLKSVSGKANLAVEVTDLENN